ncbi:aldo/keto reductase [Nesterenkonia natronophila]|uniref:Aldo/keto reductase n=1 Tax=Nesterenkonia natronophila TaxID=2174932 RepID=A0A3A4FAI5_9MICC|nr:aldo/keto reductase [Nesterenkonia natronophila]RJN32167.1 aldo/keto reductase [Nesterenkonia natronophila]
MTSTLELNSGHQIPRVGFGTSALKAPAESVSAALQAGYRAVDTAQMYRNEEAVGRGLRDSAVPRDEVFITTKLNNEFHAPPDVHRTFKESLDRLGLETVDLFLIHWPMPFLDIDYVDTWKAMVELRDAGRASAIGVSNFQPEHLERIIDATDVVPAVNQIEAHPHFANNELREFSKAHGIAVEAWSPLGKGTELSEPVIRGIAERHGRTPAQVVLRWHLQRGDIVIPKTDTPARMTENLNVLNFELSAEDMADVEALDRGESGRRSPHPNEFGP